MKIILVIVLIGLIFVDFSLTPSCYALEAISNELAWQKQAKEILPDASWVKQKTIIFCVTHTKVYFKDRGKAGFYMINSDGSKHHQILSEKIISNFKVSEDGKYVLITADAPTAADYKKFQFEDEYYLFDVERKELKLVDPSFKPSFSYREYGISREEGGVMKGYNFSSVSEKGEKLFIKQKDRTMDYLYYIDAAGNQKPIFVIISAYSLSLDALVYSKGWPNMNGPIH